MAVEWEPRDELCLGAPYHRALCVSTPGKTDHGAFENPDRHFLICGTSNLALLTLLTSERRHGDGNRTCFLKLIEIIQVKLVAHRKHWFYNGLLCVR